MKYFSRYVMAGVWNSFFGISTFLLISLVLDQTSDALVLIIAYVPNIIQAHYCQRRFVWRSRKRYFPELMKFSSAYLLQFSINLVLLLLTQGLFNLSREVRQISIALLLATVFYFVNKRGVFSVK
jgi:putative flippase GtrA